MPPIIDLLRQIIQISQYTITQLLDKRKITRRGAFALLSRRFAIWSPDCIGTWQSHKPLPRLLRPSQGEGLATTRGGVITCNDCGGTRQSHKPSPRLLRPSQGEGLATTRGGVITCNDRIGTWRSYGPSPRLIGRPDSSGPLATTSRTLRPRQPVEREARLNL